MCVREQSITNITCRVAKSGAKQSARVCNTFFIRLWFIQEDLSRHSKSHGGRVGSIVAISHKGKRYSFPMRMCGNMFCTSGSSVMKATWVMPPRLSPSEHRSKKVPGRLAPLFLTIMFPRWPLHDTPTKVSSILIHNGVLSVGVCWDAQLHHENHTRAFRNVAVLVLEMVPILKPCWMPQK